MRASFDEPLIVRPLIGQRGAIARVRLGDRPSPPKTGRGPALTELRFRARPAFYAAQRPLDASQPHQTTQRRLPLGGRGRLSHELFAAALTSCHVPLPFLHPGQASTQPTTNYGRGQRRGGRRAPHPPTRTQPTQRQRRRQRRQRRRRRRPRPPAQGVPRLQVSQARDAPSPPAARLSVFGCQGVNRGLGWAGAAMPAHRKPGGLLGALGDGCGGPAGHGGIWWCRACHCGGWREAVCNPRPVPMTNVRSKH